MPSRILAPLLVLVLLAGGVSFLDNEPNAAPATTVPEGARRRALAAAETLSRGAVSRASSVARAA
ncbi:MAG TPA: hypothetical protein VFH78_00380 [Candidatus Thermoplasmatota archaeon]|nr:hypothetical protein [Candidatus Thermoplasmatota archaeon]